MDHGEAVTLCPLVSDSRFNGPGLLQNQLKGKVDAAVVVRNLNASGAPLGPTRLIEHSIDCGFASLCREMVRFFRQTLGARHVGEKSWCDIIVEDRPRQGPIR